MRTILAIVILLTSTFTWSGSITKTRQLGVAAELPGAALKWIHIAEVEFAREKLDLDKYRISVEKEGDSVFVILTGSDRVDHSTQRSQSRPTKRSPR